MQRYHCRRRRVSSCQHKYGARAQTHFCRAWPRSATVRAVDLARALRIPTVIVPTAPGALSAVGVLVADVIKDQSRTVMFTYGTKATARLAKVFAEMEGEATKVLRGEGFPNSKQRHERSLAMRYRGQSFELEIRDISGDLVAAFHRAHRER